MAEETKYIVPSINQRAPSQLRIVKNPPSDVNPNATQEKLFQALILHCKTSHEQLEQLKG
jgi:hypothetical protein